MKSSLCVLSLGILLSISWSASGGYGYKYTYSPTETGLIPIKLRIRNSSAAMPYIVAKVTDGRPRVIRPGTVQYLDVKQEDFQYFDPVIEFDIDPRADTIAVGAVKAADATAIGHDLRLSPVFQDDLPEIDRARNALIEETARKYLRAGALSFWKVQSFKSGVTKAYLEISAPGGSINFHALIAPPEPIATAATSLRGLTPTSVLRSYVRPVQDGSVPDVAFKRLPK